MLQFFEEPSQRTPDVHTALKNCGIPNLAAMYRAKETVDTVREQFRLLGLDFSPHEPMRVAMSGLEALEGTAVEDTDDLTVMDRAVVDQALAEKGLSFEVFRAAFSLVVSDLLK